MLYEIYVIVVYILLGELGKCTVTYFIVLDVVGVYCTFFYGFVWDWQYIVYKNCIWSGSV